MHKDAKKALGAAKQYTDEAIAESGGTKDYEQLTNKPGINGVELSGNKTAAQLSLASLVDGKVPAAQLPSYVDDVIEGYLHEGHFYEDDQYTTEITGEAGKIYVDLASSRSYRWSGSAFVRVDDVDLTNYVQKSQTPGLMKNDGTVDQTPYVSDVSGKADLTLVAPVEANAAASQAYAQGSFFVHDGKFYEATAAIAQGDHIVVSGAGQNATERTLAYVLEHGDISGKADKVASATNGNFAGLDANGNLTDSGKKAGDFLTQHQDISGKANLEELAPAFSTSAGYKVGDYVTYDGGLYRFSSAHPAGAWNSSHVAKITSTGQYVTAGKSSGTALGIKATAEGKDTAATGNYAHAEGNATSASGVNSHAEGDGTNASGDAAHAEGAAMSASGDASHAEGDVTNAHGIAAHAEGSNTSAYGDYSHSEGEETEAIGEASHAQNYGTIAQRKSQTALGEFNTADVAGQDETVRGQYAVIVGNGSDDDNRSNAHTLDWLGNAWFAGQVQASSHVSETSNDAIVVSEHEIEHTKENGNGHNFVITTNAGLDVDANGIDVDSTGDVDVDSTGDINVTSGNELHLEGTEGVYIEATNSNINLEVTSGFEVSIVGDLDVSGDIKGHETFVGTSAEWTALTSTQKARYTFVCLTDDAGVYTNAPLPVLVSALTGTGSTVTRTVSNASISSDMRVIQSEVSNPSAVLSDLTVTTANGTVTISGTVNGTTDVMLLLQVCRPQITG